MSARAATTGLLAIVLAACGGGGASGGGASGLGAGGSVEARCSQSAGASAVVVGIPGDTTATLHWDASADARVRGYRLYVGEASKSYLQPYGAGIDVGSATSYRIDNLSVGTTYYVAVTAYDGVGGESCYSSEVAKLIQ